MSANRISLAGQSPSRLSFTVPGTPIVLNHYLGRRRDGGYFRTAETEAWRNKVTWTLKLLDRPYVIADKFAVEIHVYLGSGGKGDVDGFPKQVLDPLAAAGAFRNSKGKCLSDAHVTRLVIEKHRDRENPRTDVTVEALTR
jgi:Holliday junction resolvase RusA-like endonuclease